MPSIVMSSREGSAMMGKPSSAHPWEAQMSLIHSTCESTSSQLIAHSLTLRLLNSSTYLATVPSSVVQTGVKSAGCENRMPAGRHHVRGSSRLLRSLAQDLLERRGAGAGGWHRWLQSDSTDRMGSEQPKQPRNYRSAAQAGSVRGGGNRSPQPWPQ